MEKHPMLHKLLIIDDAAAVHALIRARLADEPYDIRYAFNAEDGETLINSVHPDLILLDIDLPGEDGFAFCQRLKEDPMTARIPVIFLTASNETETKVAGLDLGAVDFVTKPFDPAELRARVRASLRTKSLIDALARSRVSTFMREAIASQAA
jgi:DNA-binding response OmpR family regulator